MTKYNAKITAITPIHVGSGEKFIKGIDFIINNKTAYILDDSKILKAIGEDALERWIQTIENKKDIKQFLQERLGKTLDYSSLSSAVYPIRNSGEVQELRMGLVGIKGEHILPGSSIKGAMRTALFIEGLYKRNKPIHDRELGIDFKKTKANDMALTKEVFGNDANFNLMRFIKVGDANFLPQCSEVVLAKTLNDYNTSIEFKENLSQYLHAIAADSTTQASLIIDEVGLRRLNDIKQVSDLKLDVHELLNCFTMQTILMIEDELEYFEKKVKFNYSIEQYDFYLKHLKDILEIADSCKKNEAVLRLGFGIGWSWMTGGIIEIELQDTSELMLSDDQFMTIKTASNWKYKNLNKPKTRKMTAEGIPLGFIKITI